MSVKSVKKKLEIFFNEHNVKGLKILLAVSGGKDSITLLDACFDIRKKYNLDLSIAHFDHNLRDSSKNDAIFVKTLSGKYDLPFFTKVATKKNNNENVEMWARKKRYEFLKDILTKNNFDFIFTAHTASDASENLLMRLVSNKEPRGIYKIDNKRFLMRPLLNVLRSEIDEYVKEKNLKFVTDPTNIDTKYLRNKVRHKLIPFLKENFNKNIENFLSIRSDALEEDLSDLYGIAQKYVDELSTLKRYSKAWLKKLNEKIENLPIAVKWRVAELIAKDELHYNIGRKTSLELLDLFSLKRVAVNIPGGFRFLHSRGCVFYKKDCE